MSDAVTVRIPSTFMSYTTLIFGCPRGAGGIPLSSNWPSRLLSFVSGRSPSNTRIVTAVWLSAYVVNVSSFVAGIVVLRGISTVMFWPDVSMPSDSGHTSSSRISPAPSACDESSLLSRAAWTAAP